jgi:hypothetical protein
VIFSEMWSRGRSGCYLIVILFFGLPISAQVDTFEFDKAENQNDYKVTT